MECGFSGHKTSRTIYRCHFASLLHRVKGAMSRMACSFCLKYQLHVLIHFETSEITCELIKYNFLSSRYVSQTLFQSLQTAEMNFAGKTVWQESFQKPQLQSFSIFFYKFVHQCLLFYFLCYSYLLLTFGAVILMFHSIWWQFPLFRL